MEKIYMDNNRNRKRIVNTSVVLSFVVSFFAIVSLAMYGIVSNQETGVSYAAIPTSTTQFTFHKYEEQFGNDMQEISVGAPGTQTLYIPIYYADDDPNTQVFCVEHGADTEDDTLYTKNDEIEDFGLLYLLNNTAAKTGVKVTDATGDNAKYVEAWVTQLAIWKYLSVKYPNESIHSINATSLSQAESATSLNLYAGTAIKEENIYTVTGEQSIYEKYVEPIVEAALSASNSAKLTITKESDEFAKTEDEKWYESKLITVAGSPSSDLLNFKIAISGIEGIKVLAEDGTELTDLTALQPGTKFRIRIPADAVKEEIQTVTIAATGKFATLTGYYYLASQGDLQKVVSISDSTKSVPASLKIEISDTPDTGMNTAQTIYFIGLIVLLCGVGIVYANAKPVQVK